MTKKYARTIGIAALLLIASPLAACAAVEDETPAPRIEPDSSARALLDPATESVTMPHDAYLLSGREGRLVAHVNNLAVDDCLEESGFDFPLAQVEWEAQPDTADRLFGPWSMENAEQRGYGIITNTEVEEVNELLATYPDEWWEAFYSCNDSVEKLPDRQLNSAADPTIVDQAYQDAYDAAAQTPEWEQARQEWVGCLNEAGLEPAADGNFYVETSEDDPEGAARIALIDVDCKDDVQLVQRLSDLHAQYEAGVFAAREADFAAFQAETQDVLRQAEEKLASYGGR